ncbi:MAG: acylneuraminate cytidylyltransferase family protein [Cytophagales bacterium]|nr:acylneuraminate cytidylyltransferase family protein [Bernardetiaceae bacterium]MDW8204583.1 acylneuraminate cytidylyltransferase family protein [Cytophagales bacterium]
MNRTIVAIVPMRHHSERVPGKNYRSFNGKPLFHYITANLLQVPAITKVVIDTDSPVIMDYARRHFPQVLLLERPAHLRDGSIPMNDVLLHVVSQVHADFYLQTHSTNPLLSASTIQKAVDIFLRQFPIYDSLFSVTRLQTRLWDGLARAINHNPNILLRTQDLPPVYEENSCLYLFDKKILTERHNRIGNRPYLLEIPKHEALDIDEEIDFTVAEMVYRAVYGTNET